MSDDSDDEINRGDRGLEGVFDEDDVIGRVTNAAQFFDRKEERENKSWDLKFQNLWGNLIEET